MQRMEEKELLNCSGGGIFWAVANLVISFISLTKNLLNLRNLSG